MVTRVKITRRFLAHSDAQRNIEGSTYGRLFVVAPAVAALILCGVLGELRVTAHASSGSEEIARLRTRSASMHQQPGAVPSAPQSIGAQLGHQPTPESVQRAEVGAWSNFTAVLARAEALDAQGKHAECMDAAAEARRIHELN
jgi:hypothetical protein